MLTIFAVPKPFKGHIATIQKNAIDSWVHLRPQCEIILFGEEEGTGRIAEEFRISHVPEVARNEHGTPLLNHLFEDAQRLARHDLLCYVNCDIILMSDFIRAVEKVNEWKKCFLMVGECWNVEIDGPLSLGQRGLEQQLRILTRETGKSRGPWYIDYFVFPRDFYQRVPPFAIGRAGFDNWLIWSARASKKPVVDVTRVVTAVHQNHDYSHVLDGKNWSYSGIEAKRNSELAGGVKHFLCLSDASHCLRRTGMRRNLRAYFRLPIRWDVTKNKIKWKLISLGWRLAEWTRAIRHPLGLRMVNFKRWRGCLSRRR